jgi:hypothetical protein
LLAKNAINAAKAPPDLLVTQHDKSLKNGTGDGLVFLLRWESLLRPEKVLIQDKFNISTIRCATSN